MKKLRLSDERELAWEDGDTIVLSWREGEEERGLGLSKESIAGRVVVSLRDRVIELEAERVETARDTARRVAALAETEMVLRRKIELMREAGARLAELLFDFFNPRDARLKAIVEEARQQWVDACERVSGLASKADMVALDEMEKVLVKERAEFAEDRKRWTERIRLLEKRADRAFCVLSGGEDHRS